MAIPFKSGVILLVLAIVACASWTAAQQTLGGGATLFPSPEHPKMDFFSRGWKLQGTMKIGTTVSGGGFTSAEHGEWVSGNFFLQTKSSMHSLMGDVRGV